MRKTLLILSFILFNIIYSKSATFQSYNYKKGERISDMYKWKEPVQQSNAVIVYDRDHNDFIVGDKHYEVVVNATKWIVKRHYKFVRIEAIDNATLEKVCIKIFYFDNGHKLIAIMGENVGYRYWCY